MDVIALLSMLIDHIAIVFVNHFSFLYYFMRSVGRLAFPFYAFSVSTSYVFTSNRIKYFYRLLIIALISQLPYMFLINPIGLNVVFTLLLGYLLISLLNNDFNIKIKILFVFLSCLVSQFLNMDYGMYGILLILIFHYFHGRKSVIFHLIITLLLNQPFIQFFSVISNYWFSFKPKRYLNKYFYRYFYPSHLVLLLFFKYLFSKNIL